MADIKEVLRCYSCNKILQSVDENAPGYIKKDVLESENQSFYFCEECFEKERHHHTVKNAPEVSTDLLKILENAKKQKALFVYVINVVSFEALFSSEVNALLKGEDILVIANKIDLLPKHTDLTKIKKYIAHEFLIHGLRIKRDNILLCSALDDIQSKEVLQEVYARKGDRNVYLVGAKLSGKKTLLNGILRIYSNKAGLAIVTRTYPGTESKVMAIPFSKKSYAYDTPGIDDNNSVLHNLDRLSLQKVDILTKLKPHHMHISNKSALLFGGLGLIEVLNEKRVYFDVYMSPEIELKKISHNKADEKLIKYIKYKAIKPRLNKIKSILDFDVYEVDIDEEGDRDIGIQGLGWITFKGDQQSFRIYVPKGVAIYTSSSKVLKE